MEELDTENAEIFYLYLRKYVKKLRRKVHSKPIDEYVAIDRLVENLDIELEEKLLPGDYQRITRYMQPEENLTFEDEMYV